MQLPKNVANVRTSQVIRQMNTAKWMPPSEYYQVNTAAVGFPAPDTRPGLPTWSH